MKKVILNWLPPANIEKPSIALSVLKSYLEGYGFSNITIKYWNMLFHSVISNFYDYLEKELIEFPLSPFLGIAAEDKNDLLAKEKIKMHLFTESLKLGNNINVYLQNFDFDKLISQTRTIIQEEIRSINNDDVMLVGFSSKYYQWFPASIIAGSIKHKDKNIKIVIGGFDNSNAALSFIEYCDDVDFVIWGEGEIPLLKLCNELKNNTDYYDQIPRLIYRKNDKFEVSKDKSIAVVNINESPPPDYDDYFDQVRDEIRKDIMLPVEASRGCYWEQCKFCFFNEGHFYRTKEINKVIKEIDTLTSKYNVQNYFFVDSHVNNEKKEKLKELVDHIIIYNRQNPKPINNGLTEIMHKDFNSEIIKKLTLANFFHIQIGFESVSDSLLKKMKKSTSFSDNLLFLKFSTHYRLLCDINVIIGFPDETDEDIIESIKNLHFLRFFYRNTMLFRVIHLAISSSSKYFNEITKEEKQLYDRNYFYYLLPKNYMTEKQRFDLCSFRSSLHNKLWDYFIEMNNFYINNQYSYKIFVNEGYYIYKEYFNNNIIKVYSFTELEKWIVLTACNDKVCSFEEVEKKLFKTGIRLSTNQIKECLSELKQNSLLYYNEKFSNIISIVHTNALN